MTRVAPVALIGACALVGLPRAAAAHPGRALEPHDLWTAWSFEPFVVLPLLAACAVYILGVRRVWRTAGRGRGVRRWQAGCFGAGMFCLALALVSPLDALGGVLFSAHMTQHVVLMNLAAPLLVLAAPLAAATWALPPAARRRVGRTLGAPPLRRLWRIVTTPSFAWTLNAAVIWVWHAPSLYAATVTSGAVHALQHTSFMIAALLFWWALRDRTRHGVAVLYLFTTAAHSSILGALLAFSAAPLYAPYVATAPLWGFTPLEDQQLGGLIMWVPAGLTYFVAGIALLGVWIQRSEIGWIMNPPAFRNPAAMPVLGVTDQEARDITAYLYDIH